jgi:O-antigen ligase
MSQLYFRLIRFSEDPNGWITALAFLTPALFLVLKSVATTSLFLAFLISCCVILKEPRTYFINRGPFFWMLVMCLLAPFIAELIAQSGRGSFTGSSFDGPARAILAAGLFVYLSKNDCVRFLYALSLGAAVGIMSIFLYLHVFPEHYWDGRAATYFVDPITLPCFTIALLGLVLFIDFPRISSKFSIAIKLILSIFTLYIAIESLSRSAWVAGLVLAELYLLYICRFSLKKSVLFHLLLLLSVFILFQSSEVFSSRTLEAFGGLISFLENGGGQETSAGQRLVMFFIDAELIRRNYLFGVSDGVMPTYESLSVMVPSLNEEIYEIKTLAGSHSEFLGQLVRKGIFWGSLALWGFFLYPLYLVFFKLRLWTNSNDNLSVAILGLIFPVLISGFTIQVFNLKMTMSFYVFCLSILLAYIFQKDTARTSKPEGF